MLVFDFDVPLWFFLLLLACILLYWHGTSTYGAFKVLGVPYTPPKWPYLGNFLSWFEKSHPVADVEKVQRNPGKVVGFFQGRRPVLEVADVDMLKEITIKQLTNFRNHPNLLEGEDSLHTRHVGGTTDDHWKHVRSILAPTFTSGKLKRMFPMINDCADKLVTHLESTQSAPVEIKDYMAAFTMDVIASTAFGMDLNTQTSTDHPFVVNAGRIMGVIKNPTFMEKMNGLLKILSIFVCSKSVRLFLKNYFGFTATDSKAEAYFNEIVNRYIDSHQHDQQEQRNFLSMCLPQLADLSKVNEDEIFTTRYGFTWTTAGLTRDDLVANSVIFLGAGYETTSTALQFFFFSMATYPDIQNKLHEEIMANLPDEDIKYEEIQSLEYLDWCVNECLRMYPPVSRINREANADTVVKDIHIPNGMMVNGLVYAIHHDPDYWPEPEKFDPLRFSPENKSESQQYSFLPFGAGGRKCIASRLALLEIKVAVVKSMKAFRFEKTAETAGVDLHFKKCTSFLQTEVPIKLSVLAR